LELGFKGKDIDKQSQYRFAGQCIDQVGHLQRGEES